MGKITYHHHHDCAVMYQNIVEKYSCTNDCRFCDKEDIEMNLGGIYTMRGDLYLKKRPTLQEIIYRIDAEVEANHPQEAVFCGIAEPTLRLNTLLKANNYLKNRYSLRTRLNTNGHGSLINPQKNVPALLKEACMDSVIVSLNATTKEQYNHWHRPHNKAKSFSASIDFIKDCCSVGLDTKVSFLNLPDFDLDKIKAFILSLGLSEEQIRLRYLLKKPLL